MYLQENIILFKWKPVVDKNTLLIINNCREALSIMNLEFCQVFFFLGAVYGQMLSSLCTPPKHKVEFSSCAPDAYVSECLHDFCTCLLPSQSRKCPYLSLGKAEVSGKSRSKCRKWRKKDS